jgi:hypothetical protein
MSESLKCPADVSTSATIPAELNSTSEDDNGILAFSF